MASALIMQSSCNYAGRQSFPSQQALRKKRVSSQSALSLSRCQRVGIVTCEAISEKVGEPSAAPAEISPSTSEPVAVEAKELISKYTETVPDPEISITKTSFGSIGLVLGVFLLGYGFGGYFQLLPGSEISALMLTYGFPLTLIGFALKYAELKPVECSSYADAVALRDQQATPVLLQVRSDVTRFRYGDEQHLEEALKRIFRYNLQGGIQRRNAPTLVSIAEQVYDNSYSLVLTFDAPALTVADFAERQPKFSSFFGPDVYAVIEQYEEKKFGVRLVSLKK